MKIEKGKNTRQEEKIGRRRFLKLAPFLLLGLLSLKGDESSRIKEESKIETKKELSLEEILSEINKELINLENNNERLDYSHLEKEICEYLKDKKMSKLVEYYLMEIKTGLEEAIIDNLWEEKINLLEKIGPQEGISEIRQFKEILMDEYENLPRGYCENIENFKNYLMLCVIETLNVLDLEQLLKNERYKFEKEKKELLIEILNDELFLDHFINLLLALILNEICYISDNKEINKKILEYLLKKYGLRFLSSIPAIHDISHSFGPFQLTNFVIGKEENKFYPINFMNQFIKEFDEEIKQKYNLPNYKLPDTIYDLRLRDHFRAEILLLLFYLLELLKNIDLNTLNKYLEKRAWFYKQLVYYLGGSHHLPYQTRRLFLKFLSQDENITHEKEFLDTVKTAGKEDLSVYLERLRVNFD